MFDYFEDAVSYLSSSHSDDPALLTSCPPPSQSLRMKSNYVEQIRNAGLIGLAFLPSMFSILDVAETSTRPFDLGPWAVDEFIIERQSCLVLPATPVGRLELTSS